MRDRGQLTIWTVTLHGMRVATIQLGTNLYQAVRIARREFGVAANVTSNWIPDE